MFKSDMLAYTIVSLACLCSMAALAAAYIIKLIKGGRRERLNLMRGYKKGWFAVIYVFALFVFYMGIKYQNNSVIDSIFKAVTSTLDAVVLQFSSSTFLALCADNAVYAATLVILVALIVCNALMFFLSVGGETFANYLRVKRLLFNGCGGKFFKRQKPRRIYIIAGYNNGTRDILNSFPAGEYAIVLDDLSKRKNCADEIFITGGLITGHGYKKVDLYSFDGGDDFADYIKKLLKLTSKEDIRAQNKIDKYEIKIIINTEDDKLNIILASQLLEIIQKNAEKERAECDGRIQYFNKIVTNKEAFFAETRQPVTEEQKTALKKRLYEKFSKEAQNFVNRNFAFEVYAFNGEPDNSLTQSLAKNSYNHVHVINKYDRIAMNFQRVFPLTRFMGEDQLNYRNGTLNEVVNVNVIIIGLGSTNQQILPLSIANNQFMRVETKGGRQRVVSAPVNYWVYDNNDAAHNNSYNFAFLRYFRDEKEKRFSGKNYFPKPDPVAYCGFYNTDINTEKFYNNVKSNLSGAKGELANEKFFECGKQPPERGEKNFNYIIIGCGSDITNCDYAVKLAQKLKEWGMTENTFIFAKIRDGRLVKAVENITEKMEYYPFGTESDVVYNLKHILNERYETRAFAAHIIHTGAKNLYKAIDGDGKDNGGIKSLPDENGLNDICKYAVSSAFDEWMNFDSVQRQSNIYAHLNLKFKINLLGFDICDGPSKEDDVAEFREKIRDKEMEIPPYNSEVYPDMLTYLLDIKSLKRRKTQMDYITNNSTIELQDVMAAQEHQRWCANYIIRGMVPAPKEYSGRKKEAIGMRMHCNITTGEGMAEFRDEHEKSDVINYDYNILNESEWLITFAARGDNGYGIEKK